MKVLTERICPFCFFEFEIGDDFCVCPRCDRNTTDRQITGYDEWFLRSCGAVPCMRLKDPNPGIPVFVDS